MKYSNNLKYKQANYKHYLLLYLDADNATLVRRILVS